MKQILVTGGTGFVGNAVIQALLKYDNIQIHMILNHKDLPTDLKGVNNIATYPISLMDHEKIKKLLPEIKAEYLIHLAWNVEPQTYLNAGENLLWVAASLNLIYDFLDHGGKRVFCSGTCFEYDLQETILQENITPIRPHSFYGICKANLHFLLKEYLKQRMNQDVSLVWGRLFYLYGENEKAQRAVPYAISNFLQGKPVICKTPEDVRDYMYIQDVGAAIVQVLFSNVTGEINIASGKRVKMKDLFQMVANKCGAIEKLVLEQKPTASSTLIGDNLRLIEEVGFKAFTDLDIGLEQTIRWWKENTSW